MEGKYEDSQLEIDFRNNEDIRDILYKASEKRLEIERDAGKATLDRKRKKKRKLILITNDRVFRIQGKVVEYVEL